MSEPIHSVELEQSVLGAILYRPANIDELAGVLEPEHFYEPLHGKIFEKMRQLSADGRGITPFTLGPLLANEPPIGDFTVMQYFGRLVAAATTAYAKDHAVTVKELASRRELAEIGEWLKGCAEGIKPVSQIAAEAVQGLDDILSSSRPSRATRLSLAASADLLLENLEDQNKAKPITTGLKDLDRIIGGWRRGEYAIVAARPSMGKSAFAAETMLAAARGGHGAMIFSLEMTKEALAARCLSSVVWDWGNSVPYADVLNDRVDDDQRERLYRAAAQFTKMPIEIEDQGGLTVAEIAAKARQQAARLERDGKKLELVIVDHLGKVRASKRYAGNLVAETGEVSNALAALGKELNVAMLVLHQLNRAVEGRADKHPELSDLRNSGDIEQDADAIGFLYRPAYYLERAKLDDAELDMERMNTLSRRKNELEIIIAKNRNGPCVTCECFVDIASNVIRNKAFEGKR